MTQSPLWTATEIALATGGCLQGDFFVIGISNDTRTLQPGDLYVALGGLGLHDGHDFIDEAFAKGAAGVLVSQKSCNNSVKVPDTLEALKKLGLAARQRLSPDAKIIAITGSVGKTTTRALAAHAFNVFGKVHASRDSLNNHWGVPLTLARMPKDTQYGVFEVGMNHAGEIIELTKQVRPHVTVITAIEAVHLEFFPDGLEGIARAKAEIFASVEANGIAVLNHDNAQFSLLANLAKDNGINQIVVFGHSNDADLQLISYDRLEQGGRVTLRVDHAEFSFDLPMRSEHNTVNALAALGAVYALRLDTKQAADSFATVKDVAGRGNVNLLTIPSYGQITVIDDRHNSSPVALRSAIHELKRIPVSGRRVLALSDMRELGETAPQLHRALAEDIATNDIDFVLTCGPMMQHLADTLPFQIVRHYADSQAMAADIIHHLQDGDTLLVKGSRFGQMFHVVDALNSLSQTGG